MMGSPAKAIRIDWSWLDGTRRVAAPSEVIEEDWTREFVRRTLRRVGKMPHPGRINTAAKRNAHEHKI